MTLACVTGRFQPLHAQHLELFEHALQDAEQLIVAITNPDRAALFHSPDSPHRHRVQDNPFSYWERLQLVRAVLQEHGLAGRACIVPFDLGRPENWPDYVPLAVRQYVRIYGAWEQSKVALLQGAGYEVRALEGEPDGRRSSSDIRARMAAGADWAELVLPATRPLLRQFLAQRSMPARVAGAVHA